MNTGPMFSKIPEVRFWNSIQNKPQLPFINLIDWFVNVRILTWPKYFTWTQAISCLQPDAKILPNLRDVNSHYIKAEFTRMVAKKSPHLSAVGPFVSNQKAQEYWHRNSSSFLISFYFETSVDIFLFKSAVSCVWD